MAKLTGSKPWYASKTIWGAIITVVALALQTFKGVEIDKETQQLLVDKITLVVSDITALVGVGLTIYGRIKADKKIGG